MSYVANCFSPYYNVKQLQNGVKGGTKKKLLCNQMYIVTFKSLFKRSISKYLKIFGDKTLKKVGPTFLTPSSCLHMFFFLICLHLIFMASVNLLLGR